MEKLKPKLFSVMKTYTKEQFIKDIIAGIIVAIIALPLSIALALASGVTPERGIYTAIIAGFIISAFGGTSVQIGGPTGAFIVIVYGVVEQFGVQGLALATVLAGIIRMVETAQTSKAPVQRLADTIAAYFVPAVAVIALITFGGWLRAGARVDTALQNAVSVLVIACP